jgi:hypothetical protein
MNKKIMTATILCGLIGTAELSAFISSLNYTTRPVLSGALSSIGKRVLDGLLPQKAARGLAKELSHAAMEAGGRAWVPPTVLVKAVPPVAQTPLISSFFPSAAQMGAALLAREKSFRELKHGAFGRLTTHGAPSVITYVPAVISTSAAQVGAALLAREKSFRELMHAAYGSQAFPLVPYVAPSTALITITQATKSAVITPFKKALAAGCATAVAGIGYVGSLLVHTPPAPTAFQSVVNGLARHKILAGGSTLATVATAYCAHYKINPVAKVKGYFGTKVSK